MRSAFDEHKALRERIHVLETALARALDAERVANQRADLQTASARNAWRLSMMGPRRRPESE